LAALGLADGIMVKPAVLRRGFDVLARDGRFRAVWLNPSRRDDGVGFDLRVRRAPSGTLGVGLAYDNVLGARMWGGAVLRDPVTRTFELTGIVTFGGFRRDLLLAARRPIRGFGRPAFLLSGFAGQEEVPFYTNTGDSFYHPQVAQAIGVAGWEWQFGTTWLLRMGGEVRAWSDSNSAPHQAVGGVFLAQRATEDGEILTRVELNGTSPFQRAAVQWSEPLHAGDWIVTPTLRAGTIRGDEIPLQETFTLGGFDGFPGLRILERRGENEAFVGMSVSHPIFGPIRLRAELAAGDVRSDSTGVARALFEGEGWLVGARIGFTAPSTVLGPIRLEYGATHLGGRYRDQVFLRVGRWF
jgi:hypothetical protein